MCRQLSTATLQEIARLTTRIYCSPTDSLAYQVGASRVTILEVDRARMNSISSSNSLTSSRNINMLAHR